MSLNKLFRTLELKSGSPEEKIEGYVFALEGCTKHALDATIAKIIRGEIDGVSKKFCPTAPELNSFVREEMQRVTRELELAQERVAIRDMRKDAVPPKLIADRVADAKAKMEAEGRRHLLTCESYSAAASMRRKLPVGSTYVGILCAWYGPVGSINQPEPQPISDDEMQEILRAEMFEPEPSTDDPMLEAEQPPPAMPDERMEHEYQDVEF